MALVGTLLGKNQRVQFIQQSTGTVISLDCSVSESHSRESPPTEYPIENGNTISDNIIVKPFGLEINGVISDSPLPIKQAILTAAVSSVLPPAGVITAAGGIALYSALSQSSQPSVTAFAQLLKLQDTKLPFNVVTTLRRYENMYVKAITVPRASATGNVLDFTVSLVQLLIVSPQSVNISIFKNGDVANVGAGEGNLGKQEMQSSAVEKFKQGQAALHRAVGF